MNRQTIKDLLEFPVSVKGGLREYKHGIAWEELTGTPDILSTDIFNGVTWHDSKSGFGYSDESPTYYHPYVLVYRERLETDDEYFQRMKQEAVREEKEYLEYLRLKAKYEKE